MAAVWCTRVEIVRPRTTKGTKYTKPPHTPPQILSQGGVGLGLFLRVLRAFVVRGRTISAHAPAYPRARSARTSDTTTTSQIATYSPMNGCRFRSMSGKWTGIPANFPRGLLGKKKVL